MQKKWYFVCNRKPSRVNPPVLDWGQGDLNLSVYGLFLKAYTQYFRKKDIWIFRCTYNIS